MNPKKVKMARTPSHVFIFTALFSLFFGAPVTHADEGNTDASNSREMIKTVDKLPGPQTYRAKPSQQAFIKIMRSHDAKQQFRENIASRSFAIRVTTRPPPPFSPQTRNIEHGVAVEVNHPMGRRWTTCARLVETADTVEIRGPEGKWHMVKPRRPCATSDLAILEELPTSITDTKGSHPVRPFETRSPDTLVTGLPFFAVTNLEGFFPNLVLGALAAEESLKFGSVWTHDLSLAPGTPLLDKNGQVFLIQISPPNKKGAASPQDGFRCAPPKSDP